jgi:hypothetical protein
MHLVDSEWEAGYDTNGSNEHPIPYRMIMK